MRGVRAYVMIAAALACLVHTRRRDIAARMSWRKRCIIVDRAGAAGSGSCNAVTKRVQKAFVRVGGRWTQLTERALSRVSGVAPPTFTAYLR